jgi:hypothetical protein
MARRHAAGWSLYSDIESTLSYARRLHQATSDHLLGFVLAKLPGAVGPIEAASL